MNDNNQLLQTAWQFWHAGTGIDTEDMPPPNPSFKAGFDYGMVAAHNEHCAALIRVEELSSDAKKIAAIIGINDAEGEFVTVKQSGLADARKIRIDSTEWPALRAAIDRMIGGCRPLEITATTPS